MELNNFALSRDLLYVSGALTGAAAGFFLSLRRNDLSTRSRNRRLTAALLVLSAMLAAFAAAVIVSKGAVFKNAGVVVVTGIFVLAGILAVRFPRAAAFPMIIAGGLFVVWIGYSCLRFPRLAEAPLAFVSRPMDGDGPFVVRIFSADSRAPAFGPAAFGNAPPEKPERRITVDGGAAFLRFFVTIIEPNSRYPFIGGEKRVVLTKIIAGSGAEFPGLFPEGTLPDLCYFLFGVSVRHLNRTVTFAEIPEGTGIPVLAAELTAAADTIHTEP